MSILSEVTRLFNHHFGAPDFIARSPGRINLIGEHTDYNLGFVLPASINKAIFMAIRRRQDSEIHLVAGDLSAKFSASLDAIHRTDELWPNYILGVADQLQKAGHMLQGFEAVVMGDVPLGAGLSSSAAVECVTAFALDKLFALGLSRIEMVRLAQKAENQFVGVQCGIMDQFASVFGKKEHVIRLDCRSLDFDYIPFRQEGMQIVLFDTGIKHSLASTAYNLRRQECEAGVHLIQQKYPYVQSLRDANMILVNECLSKGDEVIYRRCTFVVEEIQRLQDACNDLARSDFDAFGKNMFLTHKGLSQLYEVSCEEADALVNMVKNSNGVYGARMMGGGFGGCTINLVKNAYADALISSVTGQYAARYNREPATYLVSIDNGTSLA